MHSGMSATRKTDFDGTQLMLLQTAIDTAFLEHAEDLRVINVLYQAQLLIGTDAFQNH